MTGRSPQDEEWAALAARAPSPWFYAVVTTGIVCRAGCTARTPLRRNVRLFADLAQAQAAGFRPCRRCRPADTAPGGTLP
ncbi:MAG: hypothetical protein KF887_13860 [Paracoccaceae bacterium]|nr:MAG: hypothetical protein KF887_13860 [Paracoccaceae bacterium]